MEEINDAIKSGNQEPLNAPTITATTIVSTMTTVTTGNGTDVTQITSQIVDETDPINAHDTFTTLEKASYEPTVPEQDNEYNENDTLEPSPKEFEHMVELHPYNHELEQFIEANSDETVDEIKRKITPETNIAKEVSKKSDGKYKAEEEIESKKEVEAAQVEKEQTQVEEEKMEVIDEEVPPVQSNTEVTNQDLIAQKDEPELLQKDAKLMSEDVELMSEPAFDIQNSNKKQIEEEKVEKIKITQISDDKETTSTTAMQLDKSKLDDYEVVPIKLNEERLHEGEHTFTILTDTDVDREPKPVDSSITDSELGSHKEISKSVFEIKEQTPKPELEAKLEGDSKSDLELEALPDLNSKGESGLEPASQLEEAPQPATEQLEKEADFEPEPKLNAEQEPETRLDAPTRSEPRLKRESRSRRGSDRKSQSKPALKPEPKLKPKTDVEEEKEEEENEEEKVEKKDDEAELKLDDENESKLDEVEAEPVEEITPRSTRPRRQTKAPPPPSPQQLKAEPEPKRPSKRSLAKEFVEEEKSLEPVEKTIKTARATSSRVSIANISTPVSQKVTTTASSRSMTSQKRGKTNDYGDDGIKRFTCHDCDYSTDRLNNIVYHKKSGCKAFQSYWNQSVESYKKDLIKSPKSNKKRYTR